RERFYRPYHLILPGDGQRSLEPCPANRRANRSVRHGSFVTLFTDMGKYHVREPRSNALPHKLSAGLIVEMAGAGRNAILYHAWIGPVSEHHRVVVRLGHKDVHPRERGTERFRYAAQVVGDSGTNAR